MKKKEIEELSNKNIEVTKKSFKIILITLAIIFIFILIVIPILKIYGGVKKIAESDTNYLTAPFNYYPFSYNNLLVEYPSFFKITQDPLVKDAIIYARGEPYCTLYIDKPGNREQALSFVLWEREIYSNRPWINDTNFYEVRNISSDKIVAIDKSFTLAKSIKMMVACKNNQGEEAFSIYLGCSRCATSNKKRIETCNQINKNQDTMFEYIINSARCK
ncbi:hypothetical protein HZA33_04415 [Candidatus Pacearchaeota archaeon]|nr:hypothetical protein [Candidatus Pacearchaeota archaeon]